MQQQVSEALSGLLVKQMDRTCVLHVFGTGCCSEILVQSRKATSSGSWLSARDNGIDFLLRLEVFPRISSMFSPVLYNGPRDFYRSSQGMISGSV